MSDRRDVISNAINKLSEIDFHSGAPSRKACFEVITVLRNAGMPDDEIVTLVQFHTGLTPSTLGKYLKEEESQADKIARMIEKYGLPERKRYVPELPKKNKELPKNAPQ